jgi:acetylornithine deacetylase/succinyl-diaminopimelate desuccinylase-like protein
MILLVAASLHLAAATPSEPPAEAARIRREVREWRHRNEAAILRSLADLLSIPNVASDAANIERNAGAIRRAFEARGARTELLRVANAPPAVFAELPAPGARHTVVFYAHYDGQPVRPAEWEGGDPWKPVLRDGPLREGGREIPWESLPSPLPPEARIYARSSSDDKAPVVGLLAALDALAQAKRRPSVNLKFFFEGEEEAGSPHLQQILSENAPQLSSDLWLLLDGPVHQTRRMALYFGARGVTDLEITVYGPSRPLHSGHYGNWAVNPIAELAWLLTTMRDDDGKIRIDGFAEAVRPPTEAEKRAVAEVPPVEEDLRKSLQLGRTEGAGKPLAELVLQPALNLRGIAGGAVGETTTNSIPTEATASIDFRLVPDLTPARVRELVEEHVRRQGYTVVHENPTPEERLAGARCARLVWGPGYPAARAPMDLPASRAVIRAVEEGTGGPVVRLPTLGGSIPMYLFSDVLHAPVVGVPIVNHDNDQHAANENLRLQNLWDGIEVYAALIAGLGGAWGSEAGR